MPSELITAFASCHPTRVMALADTYRKLKRPLITPMDALSVQVRKTLSVVETLDYGMDISPNHLEVRDNGCTVPRPLVAAYALSLCVAGRAKRVLFAGFDGYPSEDPRHAEMSEVLESIRETNPDLPLIAVTPTNYSIEQKSIYIPSL